MIDTFPNLIVKHLGKTSTTIEGGDFDMFDVYEIYITSKYGITVKVKNKQVITIEKNWYTQNYKIYNYDIFIIMIESFYDCLKNDFDLVMQIIFYNLDED